MLEIAMVILFCWLGLKALGLVFRVAWGTTRIVASVLLSLAGLALVGCLMFAGGIVLLVPVALVAAAVGVLKI